METRDYMKNYHYMTDAQRRAACRKKMARRRREVRRNVLILCGISLILLVVICSLIIGKFSSRAAESDGTYIKYYTQTELQYGQSLWDIASEYADSHYDSVADYIEEVTFINHIEDP
ncbi:MAG: hypothetical protein K5682_11795, partial [Lachnospiraceae bacterium]|nr:hypothetical protein [Lachnospiraceae bacterium]